jgi:hypothetical protein
MNGTKAIPAVRPGGLLLNFLSLFTSVGTLLCCALPSLLVLLGLGATVASFLSAVPGLVILSHHKDWVFLVSGIMIGCNFVYLYAISPRLLSRGTGCTPGAPQACNSSSRVSRMMLWISTGIYGIGVVSAYLLGPLLMRFG